MAPYLTMGIGVAVLAYGSLAFLMTAGATNLGFQLLGLPLQ